MGNIIISIFPYSKTPCLTRTRDPGVVTAQAEKVAPKGRRTTLPVVGYLPIFNYLKPQ